MKDVTLGSIVAKTNSFDFYYYPHPYPFLISILTSIMNPNPNLALTLILLTLTGGQSMNDGWTSFDNIWVAILTIFTSSTLEGWTNTMYGLMDSRSEGTVNPALNAQRERESKGSRKSEPSS